MFCGRYREILPYESSIHMCRRSMTETMRFHEGRRMFRCALHSFYLKTTFQLSAAASEQTAERLLGWTF